MCANPNSCLCAPPEAPQDPRFEESSYTRPMERTTGSLSLLTTQSLLGHARSGSNSAWKVILMRYRMTLVVAASRQLGSIDDVEDVVQTAFLQALSSLERFVYTDEGSFRRYMVQVVTNRCRDFHRKRRPDITPDLTDYAHPGSLKESFQPKSNRLRSPWTGCPNLCEKSCCSRGMRASLGTKCPRFWGRAPRPRDVVTRGRSEPCGRCWRDGRDAVPRVHRGGRPG